MGELVTQTRHDFITYLTLNRPDSRNALSRALLNELSCRVSELKEDNITRVVVITGAGDKAFCAGADLKERQGMSEQEVLKFLELIQDTFQKIAELPMPIIAALNGDAYGGGLELALACDIRIAAAHAHMGLTECSLGIIPGAGGTVRLPRIIGVARACDLIFSARRIGAQEALDLGLVNHLGDAHNFALAIAQNAPLALRAAKKALTSDQKYLTTSFSNELEAYKQILSTKDRQEGLKAFAEKRKPVYNGS